MINVKKINNEGESKTDRESGLGTPDVEKTKKKVESKTDRESVHEKERK
jgi:hypothetical protein